MANRLSTADGPTVQALQILVLVYIGESHNFYEADFKAAKSAQWCLSCGKLFTKSDRLLSDNAWYIFLSTFKYEIDTIH